MTPYPWPWVECGEVFHGWMPHGAINGMDWLIPRTCNLPRHHRGTCEWWPIQPAGFYPLRENRSERRRRLLNEKRRCA